MSQSPYNKYTIQPFKLVLRVGDIPLVGNLLQGNIFSSKLRIVVTLSKPMLDFNPLKTVIRVVQLVALITPAKLHEYCTWAGY